ncbi:C-C motif chemokine 24-like [Bufo bufo]|uniref:C-C motif chemokine 24-like n=1 Tax=Bufo bufo TaxID=8384 RepID=UPI001ABDED33|nr:C-C motif chemokine 24-like [Bufo bufo]
MSTLRVLLSLALLVICAMCEASTGKFSTCCTQVSAGKPSPDTIIENFIIQPKDLPCVHAVMFITNKGKIICSTPSARWVKLKVQEIRKKNEKENNDLKNED